MYQIFFFYSSQTEYGAVDALNIPLLHTWSLSIEEQFYLFFPIIISIVYKFKKEKITALLLFLSLVSLCVAEIMSRHDSILNFFSTLSRIWELLLGSIFAVFVIEGKLKFKYRYENLLCYAGFLSIIIPILTFNDSTRNPSLLTLIPVIGTCLVIITTDKNKNFLNFVLSSKILV